MNKTLVIILSTFLFACSTEGVKSEKKVGIEQDTNTVNDVDTSSKEITQDSTLGNKELAPGLNILWEKKTDADRLKIGDVVKVDFVGRNSKGKIFDSSKKIKRYIPVRVGWGMVVEGWDLAMKEMALGEKAKISVPADLAYGEKGDGRNIEPNSDITIELEIMEKVKPVFDSAGIKVYIVEKFLEDKNPKAVKDGVKLMFDYWSFTDEGKRYDSSYEKGHSFVYFVGDKNLNFGLRKGLEQLKEGESAYIHVPSEHGFGKKGLKGMVKPNQDIMFIVTIKKVE